MKKILFVGALAFSVAAQAQSSVVFNMLSSDGGMGSARYMALGGAMGALGNDASAAADNPAGIGTYRSSELQIDWQGGLMTRQDPTGIQIPNVSYVRVTPIAKGYQFNGFFAFQNDTWSGNQWQSIESNPNERMVDQWLDASQGINGPDELLAAGLLGAYTAYQGYVLEYDEDNDEFFDLSQGLPSQRVTLIKQGFQSNRLVAGASLRTPQLSIGLSRSYVQASAFEALVVDEDGFSGYTSGYTYSQSDSMSISGASSSLGVILRLPLDLQAGMRISMPDVASLDWYSRYRMTARTTNNDSPFELTDKETWETLPGISTAFSLAKKFQSKGFIAVEYHRKSLPEQTIISPISAIGIGQDLLDDLVVVEGVRVGMEWRKGPLAYRFGYQQSNAGTQFKDHSGFQRGSVGLGYRSDQASIHLALVSNYRQARIYNPTTSDLWAVNAWQHQLVIGVSFRV